ncbi:FAD-dependent oxidoreductase [Hydrogenophaga sp. BPS33]|uniref:FAD-dependent oxidoreductase n=1 Tax=Hydrogenophaga sp. BPS33 TaxID=2651974 RepID=UPI00131F8A2F|nr:FAD-dependent oxidoreductase [Hydrogenophaga sp. BPS33]QHE86297.1 FAD-dependent oxidoreductase [Hydrogenophaga sp. BPS33]
MPDSSARHALVIGAGLAGAATCAALARRGWRLTLLDAATGPAQGASALPVGMLSPHVTRAPTPMSRLSALGVAATLDELQRRVPQGHGWRTCEVDNLGHHPGRWPAAMVRPAALVKAWLDESAQLGLLECRWQANVHKLLRQSGLWQALDTHGECLAQAPVVVVASAYGSHALLTGASSLVDGDALPLRPVKGQMSLGELHEAPWAARPQRDDGVFVPCYEDAGLAPQWPTRLWAMGSTYERGENSTHLSASAHERNAIGLESLCAPAAAALREAQAQGSLLGWAQVRCASQDRLPLVGAVPDGKTLEERMVQAGPRRGRMSLAETPRHDGLFMLSALGSRGIALAPWCASRLAATMEGEPTPDEQADLLRAIDPARFASKRARR